MLLEDKKLLITGVLSQRSIAYGTVLIPAFVIPAALIALPLSM